MQEIQSTNEYELSHDTKCDIQAISVSALELGILSLFFPIIGFILSAIGLLQTRKASNLGGGLLTGIGVAARVINTISLVFNTISIIAMLLYVIFYFFFILGGASVGPAVMF